MTNGEKYKTAKERAEAFERFLKFDLDVMVAPIVREAFSWLDLEAKVEESLPCPFCGQRTEAYQLHEPDNNGIVVLCTQCSYKTMSYSSREHAIAAHNRVARAAKEKEASDANA